MNRAIRARGSARFSSPGPVTAGPAVVASAYLDGTYSEVYPHIGRDEEGLRRLVRQFSFPGGIPSHVAPETPGSIHEGGELGYALLHAYGAVLDNPDLLGAVRGRRRRGGDRARWQRAGTRTSSSNPARDGAVLPVLHLNGYKIANPTVLARIPGDELRALLEGYGYAPRFVEGSDPAEMHGLMAAALDEVLDEIGAIQRRAREDGDLTRPRWPMIVLKTPKGWTGPKVVDGLPVEGTWRAHQVPLAEVRTNPQHLALLEEWMRSYRPEELFDETGAVVPEITALAPKGELRMSANPHTNGGLLLHDLELPDFRDYAVTVSAPAATTSEATRVLGGWLRDVMSANPDRFRFMGPDETASNRLSAVFEATERVWEAELLPTDDHLSPRWARHGGSLRASVPGVARGLPAHRPPRPVQLLRGVHPHHRLDVQPAREVAEGDRAHPVAPAVAVAQLPALFARVAPGPQRVLPPGSRLHRPRREQEGGDHPGVPAARRQLPAVGRRPLSAQPPLRERDRRRQAAGARTI